MPVLNEKPSLKEMLGKKTLFLGEVASGKTRILAKIVDELVNMGLGRETTVIDMAPRKTCVGKVKIGGTIQEYTSKTHVVRYLRPKKVFTPRISSRNKKELIKMALSNAEALNPLLNLYLKQPTRILLMNDLTIYLHAGQLTKILTCIKKAKTFIGTAYKGKYLEKDMNTGLSRKERELTQELMKFMDQNVFLTPVKPKQKRAVTIC